MNVGMRASCQLPNTNQSTSCLPHASAVWLPDEWSSSPSLTAAAITEPTLPVAVSRERLERFCRGHMLRTARSAWTNTVRRQSAWGKYSYLETEQGLKGSPPLARRNPTYASTADRVQHCMRSLSSFRPKVCTVANVSVWGARRRLYPTSGHPVLYAPPDGVRVHGAPVGHAAARSCESMMRHAPFDCSTHAVVGRNMVGVGFFHSFIESLASLAFLLEHTASAHLDVLENVCISAEGSQSHPDMRHRMCAGGAPPAWIRSMFGFLGIESSRVRHYPWRSQHEGPRVELGRATFDCSDGPSTGYWHMLKLREVLAARFRTPPPAQDSIVLVDRNHCVSCNKGGASDWRRVVTMEAVVAAVRRRFADVGLGESDEQAAQTGRLQRYRVVTHTGGGSFAEQAAAFRRAAVVVSPHGATLSLMIFCQPGTASAPHAHAPAPTSSMITEHVPVDAHLPAPLWAPPRRRPAAHRCCT